MFRIKDKGFVFYFNFGFTKYDFSNKNNGDYHFRELVYHFR
jgi:hypothetical protein